MGFSSMDDLVSKISAGKFYRADFMKSYTGGTVVAGRWYDLSIFGGNPAQIIHGNLISNGDFLGGAVFWTVGSVNWAYTPATHLMTRTASADGSTLSQNTKCIRGQSYDVVYTVTRTAGSVTISLGGTNGTSRSSSATFRENIVCGATANAPLVITPDASFAGTVDVVVVTLNLAFRAYDQSNDLSLWHGGNPPAGQTKHLINFGCWPLAALSAPAVLVLVDVLGVYPRIPTNNASSQPLTIPNRVFNGTFTGGLTGWTAGSGNWTGVGDKARRTASADLSTLSQPVPTRVAQSYTVTYTISNRSAGTVTVKLGGVSGTPRSTNATFSEVIDTIDETDLFFMPDATFNGDIDDVTVVVRLPRYTDGAGVRAFYMVDTAPGANARNFNMIYTNSDGTGGRNLGATVACTASSIVGHMEHSGIAAGNYGPFLPMAPGDAGIRSVESVQFSVASASAGFVNLLLCRPIAFLPLTTVSVAAERDLLSQLPSLPKIENDACLAFIVCAGAVIPSGAQYQGYCDFVWG